MVRENSKVLKNVKIICKKFITNIFNSHDGIGVVVTRSIFKYLKIDTYNAENSSGGPESEVRFLYPVHISLLIFGFIELLTTYLG